MRRTGSRPTEASRQMSKAQPLGNAEPVQDLREIDAAHTALGRIGIDDRFGGEESAFQRIHGADVRYGV